MTDRGDALGTRKKTFQAITDRLGTHKNIASPDELIIKLTAGKR